MYSCPVQYATHASVRGRTLSLETANTAEKRRMGLMGRQILEDNSGMFFPSKQKEMQSFWMKNTHIPLDMIFVDRTNSISKIAEQVTPMSLDYVRQEACYVIETNGGWAEKNNVQVGDTIYFSVNRFT